MQAVPTGLRTHSQRVCSLYKRAVRNIEAWESTSFETARYKSLMVRKEIEDNRNIKDLRIAKELLEKAEREVEKNWHPQPKCFQDSPGGCAYDRELDPPDWVMDTWEPIEKAPFPKYFTLREQRKKEYKELFDKWYPDAQKTFDH